LVVAPGSLQSTDVVRPCLDSSEHVSTLVLAGTTITRGARFLQRDETRAASLYPVGRETHTHDAIMRIGGEAPRRRAHSTPRHESHVGTRVAATSNRHRQTATLLRDAPKLSGVRRQIASRGVDQLTPDA
jgi:hypothetical protein